MNMRGASFFQLIIVCCLCLNYSSALPQACCSGGVPLASVLGTGTSEAKNGQLLITYDINILKDLVAQSNQLSDANRTRSIHSFLAEFNYGLNNQFTVTTLFSYLYQQRKIIQTNGSTDELSVNGLGDIVLLIKYNILWRKPYSSWAAAIGAGPKIPGGMSDVRQNGILLPADLQPGTGAWDAIFWFYSRKQFIFRTPLRFVSLATYRVTGTNHDFYANGSSELGYKFGNEFQYNIGLEYQITNRLILSDMLFQVRYRGTTSDKVGGQNIPNTGGKWVYIIPGINLHPNMKWSFRFTGEFPVYRYLTGTQLTTSYKFNIAFFYNFLSPVNTF